MAYLKLQKQIIQKKIKTAIEEIILYNKNKLTNITNIEIAKKNMK